MRCLALEQHLGDEEGSSVFVTCINTPFIRARLRSEGVKVIQLNVTAGSIDDAKQTISLAKKMAASWIVVDGYNFNTRYQQLIKNSGLHLLFIDDLCSADHYYADILLNQNIYASEDLYSNREPYTSLLLGTRYVLLRKEFLKWQNWKREIPQTAQKLLVTLGGSDHENITQKVVDAIQQIKVNGLNVIIVAAHNSHYRELKSKVQRSKVTMQLKRNISNISDLMAWADVAVSAGGTSTWELAFMGLPALSIAIADNQCQVVEELSKAGIIVNLGWHQSITISGMANAISQLLRNSETRARMSKCAQCLVDGKGVHRVLALMKEMSSPCKEGNQWK